MTYTNEQLKKAFFAVLDHMDYLFSKADLDGELYCWHCPLYNRDTTQCPARDPEDDYEIDGDICREELLKFYATSD